MNTHVIWSKQSVSWVGKRKYDSQKSFLTALRPALKPLASVSGLIVGSVLSGSFAVEIVTAWPGLGRLMYEALVSRDVELVAGCAAFGSILLALGTLASDLLLAAADPRLRELR